MLSLYKLLSISKALFNDITIQMELNMNFHKFNFEAFSKFCDKVEIFVNLCS